MNKRKFHIMEEGTRYCLDCYEIKDGVGLSPTYGTMEVAFVRGSKMGHDEVVRSVGVIHEDLLSMVIHDLKYKNKLVPSREGSIVITKLEEALLWMEERQRQREAQNVAGTYQTHNS